VTTPDYNAPALGSSANSGITNLPIQGNVVDPQYDLGSLLNLDTANVQEMKTLVYAQPLDSLVLTPTGFVKMGELRVGDEVVSGYDGATTRVTRIHERGVMEVFEVTFKDGRRAKCTGDHLWPVHHWDSTNYSVKSVEELQTYTYGGRGGKQLGLIRSCGLPRWRVPFAPIAQFKEQRLPIDPYLLGLLLGDGTFDKYGVSLVTAEETDYDLVLPKGVGIRTSVCSPTLTGGKEYKELHFVSSSKSEYYNPMNQIVRKLGLEGRTKNDKFVPKSYLFSSAEQRLALLQGLIDSDGSVSPEGAVAFYNSNPQLIEDVKFLVDSLGGNYTLSTNPPVSHYSTKYDCWFNSKTGYELRFRLPPDLVPARLERKASRYKCTKTTVLQRTRGIVDIQPVGHEVVRCITIDREDGLYITDEFIVTHNSPDVRVWIARGSKQYDVSQDVVGGSILRKENSASSAVVRLANKDKRYNGIFHRMDRITIFLKRINWVQVFSGYLDSVPLLQLRPGVVTLRATCTIKRLMHTWWDPGLAPSAALLQQRWNDTDESPDGQGQPDAGIGSTLRRVLTEVGGWDNSNIHIQEVPRTFLDFLSMNLGQMSQENQKAAEEFRKLLLGSDTSGGIGSSAGRSYNTTTGTYTLGQQHYIADIIAATDARSMGPITTDISVGQELQKTSEQGVAANQERAFNQEANDTPAWENVGTLGSQFEQTARDSDAAILAVATALVESELLMRANLAVPESLNFPHDAMSTDHDSIGLFQQRSSGWGSVSQRMNALASAGMFLNALSAFDWRNMEPGAACQRVQVSAFPEKYALRMADAKSLVQAARAGQQGQTAAPIPQGITSVEDLIGGAPGLQGATQTPAGPSEVLNAAKGKPNPDSEGAIQTAMRQIGKPYVWGAKGPDAFDCSGLTQYAYRAIGLDIGAGTAGQLLNGTRVPPSQIQRGDLVFPHSGHVTIWLGDGTVLEASTSSQPVHIIPVYFDLNNVYDIRHYADNGGPDPTVVGMDPSISGPGLPPATGVGNAAGGAGQEESIARNLFSYMFEHSKFQSKISTMFTGEKAYINDEPLIQIVQALTGAGLRNYCSAPNGDFVAYYPDYFGLDGKLAVVEIQDIEMKDVSVDFNDDALTTHVYVAGDNQQGIGNPINEMGWLMSHGVATVENPWLFGALTAMSIGFPEQMSGSEIMRRYGVRPLRREYSNVASKEMEFLLACQIFMQKWAEQFTTRVEFTFMPELFPGMRVQLAGHSLQVYVSEVSHTWDFEDGFTTSATIMAPSNPNITNITDKLGQIYKYTTDQQMGGMTSDLMDGL